MHCKAHLNGILHNLIVEGKQGGGGDLSAWVV